MYLGYSGQGLGSVALLFLDRGLPLPTGACYSPSPVNRGGGGHVPFFGQGIGIGHEVGHFPLEALEASFCLKVFILLPL